ncbi:unnamed protein product [Medioppia subpectinata]|uniref:Gamma-butyrobetaine dioxygenase n=1 Tax=Medioppia subpectinata TaxID=1979941 RepID=A0A7R9PVQ5_9ACAR|nr:unnamed protein product [Medioppia subpectinata]CAG2102053.1 unnamed protein product [Medioppia subpectinata]
MIVQICYELVLNRMKSHYISGVIDMRAENPLTLKGGDQRRVYTCEKGKKISAPKVMHRIALKCGRFYRSIPRCVNISLNNYNKSIPRLQYVTNSESIDSKTVLDNADDKPIDRTIPPRNGYQSTADAINSIDTIKFFANENIIQIRFRSGQNVNLNTTWLRDSCACSQCVHPITKTRLINSADISGHLIADRITCFDRYIEIQWRDESNKEHTSRYANNWLKLFVHDSKSHIAYSGQPLEAHTDLPYRERSPGVQLLHCLESAAVGGASTVVDAVKCAEVLRETSCELFQLLTKYPVLFAFCHKENDIWFREKWPIIGLNTDDSIKEIHYSRIAMRPPLLPLHILDKFYEAYRKLTQLLRDDKYVFRYFLRAGDLIIINNRRILHGRDGFDHFTQNRHLMGCYLDLDEVEALYEKLNYL